ncbi:hypothetical protein [Salinirussus salinus]|jgi:hypothetical protein|uniref:hypothetical protein n=1 Tax=Salinirussus salinus TaxID=1198300 RepID=UPI00135C15E7|nr:hypothetical protein [Salinirussus salinus]
MSAVPADSRIPAGYVHDPHDPDYYIERCPDCGSREKRHKHPGRTECGTCNRLCGVTPVSRASDPEKSDKQTVMTDGGRDTRDDERPEVTDDEFLQAVETLGRVKEQVAELTAAFESIDTGLTQTDTVALLYGRRNGLNKTTAEEAFQTLSDIGSKSDRELVVRLLSQYSDLNLSESEEFLSEVETLRNRYGDKGGGTDA